MAAAKYLVVGKRGDFITVKGLYSVKAVARGHAKSMARTTTATVTLYTVTDREKVI